MNTFYRVEFSRGYGEAPLTMWATNMHLLARICIALNCKKPAIAVEKYQVKEVMSA